MLLLFLMLILSLYILWINLMMRNELYMKHQLMRMRLRYLLKK